MAPVYAAASWGLGWSGRVFPHLAGGSVFVGIERIGCLLFFRLGAEPIGFVFLSPLQPYLSSVEQNLCYRNSCSLPSERQRETDEVVCGSIF